MIQLGLRSRVAVVFGALSMVVALLISGAIYSVGRSYLTNQRQTQGLTRALLDAQSADAASPVVSTRSTRSDSCRCPARRRR